MQSSEILKRITCNSEIMGGKPIIRGMRFGVDDLLNYLASGMTAEEIVADFSYLEKEDIQAILLFAAHKFSHNVMHVSTDGD
jgi:uncharacterized protein (DUF433 family)